MTKDEIKSFLIMTFILGVTVTATLWWAEARKLPVVPDLTCTEMNTRIDDYGQSHLQNCLVCQDAANTPNLKAPKCYLDARDRGLIVGDWKMTGCRMDAKTCLWRYIGRPQPGWRWSDLHQCWLPTRRIPR